MMMNRAKFLQNGQSGYVLKPQNGKLKVNLNYDFKAVFNHNFLLDDQVP